MNLDAATSAWLRQQLAVILGFPDVEEIAVHISTSFRKRHELEEYLTELLGIPRQRATTISARLLPEPSAMPPAAPLVPKPTRNTRIKQGKIKKPSKLLHSRIINCLRCGKIEYNGARQCSFCDTDLVYEDLSAGNASGEYSKMQADAEMKRLVALDVDTTSALPVVDTEAVLYEEVETEQDRRARPMVVGLDLENRVFVEAAASPATLVVTENRTLSKDAQQLLRSMHARLAKHQPKARSSAPTSSTQPLAREPATTLDDYDALYL